MNIPIYYGKIKHVPNHQPDDVDLPHVDLPHAIPNWMENSLILIYYY